jgi:dTDP-glucose 4,6-dehydratase/UDP-glucose 4-epimerase
MSMTSKVPFNPIHHDLNEIMMRMAGLWESFRNESIFITGGTGLFGRWLLETIVHANQQLNLNLTVTVLTRNEMAFRRKVPHLALDPAIDFHQGDVRDFEFPNRRYTYFIHGAATSADETFLGEDSLRKFDTLVDGTRRTLNFAVKCQAKRFLLLSSGVVYGSPSSNIEFIPEDYSGAPDSLDENSALGQAKRSAEFLCAYYSRKYELDCSVARCFSFVGPFLPLDIHYAIGNFIGQALFRDEIIVKGDGLSIRSFLYMADLVTWLLTLLLKGENRQAYNVGSNQAIDIRQLAYLVRDELSPYKVVRVLGEPEYSVGNAIRNRYVPCIEKVRQEFGLDIWASLPDAIRRTARYATRGVPAIVKDELWNKN